MSTEGNNKLGAIWIVDNALFHIDTHTHTHIQRQTANDNACNFWRSVTFLRTTL